MNSENTLLEPPPHGLKVHPCNPSAVECVRSVSLVYARHWGRRELSQKGKQKTQTNNPLPTPHLQELCQAESFRLSRLLQKVVFISAAATASVKRDRLSLPGDVPIHRSWKGGRHCPVVLPRIGLEADYVWCTGHSWRQQPAAVSKFKGPRADLLSPAFLFISVSRSRSV